MATGAYLSHQMKFDITDLDLSQARIYKLKLEPSSPA